MWVSSSYSLEVALLSFLLLYCTFIQPTRSVVTLTQNVTNTGDNVTVFPGIVIRLECETNNATLRWELEDGTNLIISSGTNVGMSFSRGPFTIMRLNTSTIISTATIVASSNTSIRCNDFDTVESININIKPVIPQISLIQSVTNDSSNATICPNTPISLTCQSNTGVVVWSLDDGRNATLTRLGETKELGGFRLEVTNVTVLLLLVESTAVVESLSSDFTLTCRTALENGLSASLSVSVRRLPYSVMSVNVTEVCYESISFNWTDTANALGTPKLDHYLVTISPPPPSPSPRQYRVNDSMSAVVKGLGSNILYTVNVSAVNCAGTSPSVQFQRTITTIEPSTPTIIALDTVHVSNGTSTISVQWEPGSSTNCLQPPITRYSIIISGVLRSEESFNGSQTNATFTIPSCGASAVTVSAVNSAGTSIRSDPEIFTGSSLSIFVSATSVDVDSVTLMVTVSECVRPVVNNITITYGVPPAKLESTKTGSYPNNSESASIALTDLQPSTAYRATVVVYYRESERINSLGPYNVNFTTTERASNAEGLIVGLSVGLSLSLIIGAVLVVIIFFGYYRFRKYRKRLRGDFDQIKAKQKEIQSELQDYANLVQTHPTNVVQSLPATLDPMKHGSIPRATNVVYVRADSNDPKLEGGSRYNTLSRK